MSSEAEGQKSCHSLRELSLSGLMSLPQTRQCTCRTRITVSLIVGESLVNPLILAEHDSPLNETWSYFFIVVATYG